MSLLAALRRAGVKHYRGARELRIEGTGRASALSFRHRNVQRRIAAELILLHQGVVPNTQISWALRLEHHWNPSQLCWSASRDTWGETSQPGIFIAGDGGSIGGALAARLQGRIAALRVAEQLQRLDACALEHHAVPLQRALNQQLAARPLIDALYRPQQETRIPADDVTLCRCEEVSAGEVRRLSISGVWAPTRPRRLAVVAWVPVKVDYAA